MSIAAIVVNYQAGALVLRHAPRVLEELASVPGSHLYVVDNASPNGDAALLREGLADLAGATLIEAPRNGGFSYGNNRGIERALADAPYDHLYLLNPDAYPLPGCLRTLLSFLDQHPKAGILGSRLVGEDGAVQRSAFRYPSLASEFDGAAATGPISRLLARYDVAPPASEAAHRADWVCGASMLFPRALWAAAGPMDEDYFLYFEETDFQRAAELAGFETWYVPDAEAVHLVAQSTGMTHMEGVTPPYWYDSRRRYFAKNHGATYARLADAARAAGRTVAATRATLGAGGAGARAGEGEALREARKRSGTKKRLGA